jgi:hypothetical protein
MVTGAGGTTVSPGSTVSGRSEVGVTVGASVGGSVGVAVGASVGGVVGVAVGTSVGGSVGCPVGVSAAGACASTSDGLGSVRSANAKINTAAAKIKYKGLDCLMGKSPIQAIKPVIIKDR